jgi:predicted RNA-binding protein YlxR (DUF448 family)
MVRVVRLGDGTLASGRTLPGRGAWLCRDSASCVDLAVKRRAFERALRGPIGAGAVDDLRRVLEGTAGPTGHGGSESPAL